MNFGSQKSTRKYSFNFANVIPSPQPRKTEHLAVLCFSLFEISILNPANSLAASPTHS
jgi:hypothetical protein